MNARHHPLARTLLWAVLLLALALALGVAGTQSALAQSSLGVKVQPTSIEDTVDPGATLSGTLRVTNEEGGTQTYYLDTRNVTGMETSGTPIFATGPSTDPTLPAEWITLGEPSITVDQGQTVEVPYTITVPKDASPGSYAAALFVSRQATRTAENGAGVGFNVASLVILRVSGDAKEELIFREFSTAKTMYTSPSGVSFNVRLENLGNVHERPIGIVNITDMLGNAVGQVTFNDQEGQHGAILPHTQRDFAIDWVPKGFSIGRYHALASVVYGTTDRTTITHEVTFWILPMKEIGIYGGGLLLIVLLFVFLMRAYVRRALRRAGHASYGTAKQTGTLGARMMRTFVWVIIALVVVGLLIVVFFGS